ncbi:DNA polymerase III subunit gamma/tau C-terminal domain-containing protein, partial [Xanthomonas cerealis]
APAPAVAAAKPTPAPAPVAAAAVLDPPWETAAPASAPAPATTPAATAATAAPLASRPAASPEPEMAMVPPLTVAARRPLDYAAPRVLHAAEDWLELVADCGLAGPSRQLAANAAFVSHADGVLRLSLSPGFEYLQSERSLGELSAALADALGSRPKIVIESGIAVDAETLHERSHRQRGERQSAAETAFLQDPAVQALIQQQGARVVPDSIRPYQE